MTAVVLDRRAVVPAQPGPGAVPGSSAGGGAQWALVVRAQAGDRDAFAAIYEQTRGAVQRYLRWQLRQAPGGRDLADDLTSEVYVRALRNIGSVTWQGRDIGAWLTTIARNLVVDHFKRASVRLERPFGGEVLLSDRVARTDRHMEPDPADTVGAYLTNRQLLGLVLRLNAEQRECITLRFLQGLSVAETAEAMGKNEGAVKALQYRAVRSLARLLPVDWRNPA